MTQRRRGATTNIASPTREPSIGRPGRLISAYGRTIKVCAYSLITISAMLAIGTLTRLSGIDATLGLAFAGTGVLYPFFGTLRGWLGVALTGSDTASNTLFGNLQKITSEQLWLPGRPR